MYNVEMMQRKNKEQHSVCKILLKENIDSCKLYKSLKQY